MAKTFLFPGQGSQKVGMGADFYAKVDSARKRFDEANEILGRDLKKLTFEGPQEALTATQNTQPALFTVEAAICDALRERGIAASVALGHSLGEYSALYAAGVYSFADGVSIVARRGELMAEAGKVARGTMAAVIGLSRDTIVEVLASVGGIVGPANENAPEQTVISGEVDAVKAASEELSAAGAKRVVALPVSGAFHSPLMQQAAEEFSVFLQSYAFADPQCPVVCNVTAAAETHGETIRDLLVRQLTSPVRWVESMACIKARGATDCIEVGPGSVLRGLARKCDSDINVDPGETVDNIYSLALERR